MTRRPTRKPRIIGPFFVIALMLSVGLLYWQRQQKERQFAAMPPPVVEHQVIPGVAMPESSPDPKFVQEQAAALKLTAGQTRQLAPIVTRYEAEVASLQRPLDAAGEQFAQYQQNAAKRKKLPPATEIQERMVLFSQLSGRVAGLRQQYWAETAQVLKADQQTQAKALWDAKLRGQSAPAASQQGDVKRGQAHP